MSIDSSDYTAAGAPRRAVRAPGSRTGLGSQRYLRLFQCLTPLIGCHDVCEIHLRACEMLAEILDVKDCSCLMANARRTELALMAATHIPPTEWPTVRLPVDQGVCGQVFRQGTALLVRGQAHFRKYFGRNSEARYRAPSCVVVPLRLHGAIAGVLNVANPVGRRAFAPRDVELIEAAGQMMAAALERANEHSEALLLHRNLEDIFDSLLVGVLSVDSEGIVTHTNHRARTLFGLPDRHAPELPLSEVLPGTIYNVCRRLMKQADRETEPAQERFKTNLNGGAIMIEVTVSGLRRMAGARGDRLLMFE
ncbi:MAG: GAF domain-containing protein, partial [bacterium]|nr:GAF domain-containing protein [bacterium]